MAGLGRNGAQQRPDYRRHGRRRHAQWRSTPGLCRAPALGRSDTIAAMTWRCRWWLVLAGILALAGALRCARMGFGSLTFDEQWHLELSTGRGSPHVRLPDDVLIAEAPAVTSLVNAPPAWAVWTHMDRVVHTPLIVLGL